MWLFDHYNKTDTVPKDAAAICVGWSCPGQSVRFYHLLEGPPSTPS